LGQAELEDMIQTQGGANVQCHFCDKSYDFTAAELKDLLEVALSRDEEA